ncbi:hypothetical protein FRC17_011041 [Serendipita sp. 399]|nr:hypothetical protein FRC17_011041 [Serendipita sp. 399]
MRLFSTIVFAVAVAQQALAHYRFLGINGSGEYDYIRLYANHYSNGPITNVQSTDIRCNLQAPTTTGTLTVAAGSTATFSVYTSIGHPGPLLWYMAKAPGTVNGWDGSGNVWFKIGQTGATFSNGAMSWPSSGLTSVTITIPSSLPSGEYLLRVEHIALHGAGSAGGSQHYISCAQLKVTGGGSGNPGPLVSFPGAYSPQDPGILITQQALAHYRFVGLNGSGDFSYVRPWANSPLGPVTDVSSPSIRCNTGAALTTGTLTIPAGSTVTFRVDPSVTHPGPLLWYMAKALSSVNGWDGIGTVWFKIAQTGAVVSGSTITWPAQGLTKVSARIPSSLPAGEYLLRVEHIDVSGTPGTVSRNGHYISCAQVAVTGSGTGKPSPLVAFPGAYDPTPGIPLPLPTPTPIPPGPPVWQG